MRRPRGTSAPTSPPASARKPPITTAGTPFGSGTAANTIGLSSAWLSESVEPAFTGGVGVGYVWGPQFRTDLTVDLHSTMNAAFNGTQTYTDGGPIRR